MVVLTGIFSLGYVPSKLIVWDDPSQTLQHIRASESLFRMGIMAGIICYISFLILPFILYKLLHETNKTYALGMVILAAVSVPLSLVNLSNRFALLSLLEHTSPLYSLDPRQVLAQVNFYLYQYSYGIKLSSIFWGLWLFPFGYLVFRCGFLPKALGIFLMAGCFGYLIDFAGDFFSPAYQQMSISRLVTLPATIGEIGISLYLLIAGIKKQIPPSDLTI